jgi:hypothetical protein
MDDIVTEGIGIFLGQRPRAHGSPACRHGRLGPGARRCCPRDPIDRIGKDSYSSHINPPGGLANYYRNNVIGGAGAFVAVAENFNSSAKPSPKS